MTDVQVPDPGRPQPISPPPPRPDDLERDDPERDDPEEPEQEKPPKKPPMRNRGHRARDEAGTIRLAFLRVKAPPRGKAQHRDHCDVNSEQSHVLHRHAPGAVSSKR